MEERRQHSHVKGSDMDDLKDRLTRIEKQGVDGHIAQKVMENSFETHRDQNEKDFQHIDECLHRSETESKDRDDNIKEDIKSMKSDILDLKKTVWMAMGALVFIQFALKYINFKALSTIVGG